MSAEAATCPKCGREVQAVRVGHAGAGAELARAAADQTITVVLRQHNFDKDKRASYTADSADVDDSGALWVKNGTTIVAGYAPGRWDWWERG